MALQMLAFVGTTVVLLVVIALLGIVSKPTEQKTVPHH